MMGFMQKAGVSVMFDLNELAGRDCTQKGQKPWQPNSWCGDTPNRWDMQPLRHFLRYIKQSEMSGIVAFELGNELFRPLHLSHETAVSDIRALGPILKEIFGEASPPLYATGTNDCDGNDNSDIMEGLLATGKANGIPVGFSCHSYPGDMVKIDKHGLDLRTILLNSTWLRAVTTAQIAPCLKAWNNGPREAGLRFAITEASSHSGRSMPDSPDTTDFIQGFFSLAQFGQFARAGVDVLARWGIPGMLGLNKGGSGSGTSSTNVASDYFLYRLFRDLVGPGVLGVTGDEASGALVYAHCAGGERYGTNGSVAVFVSNPSDAAVTLNLSLPSIPRFEWKLTAPQGGLTSKTPVLNGDESHPLKVATDGAMPPMPGHFVGESGDERVAVQPRSQSFFVLTGAGAAACK